MRFIEEMMQIVKQRLLKANIPIITERWIVADGHKLGFLHTYYKDYLLKFNREFDAAGRLIKELNGGKHAPGHTIPMKIYLEMMDLNPTILFATPESDSVILSISFDEFTRLSEPYTHTQKDSKEVRVILTKSLSVWPGD